MSTKAVSGGRVSRSLRPARLAGRAVVRWAGTYAAWGDRRTRRREQFVMRTAEDVTRTMGDMKGAVMKFGQILSLMSGVLPDEMSAQLASLQSNAPPMSYHLVEEVFAREYGRPPSKVSGTSSTSHSPRRRSVRCIERPCTTGGAWR